MADGPRLRVVIVGAGLGGLALAQGLRKAAVDCVVCEQATAAAVHGQGYRLHLDSRGARALHECLPPELYSLFLATSAPPSLRVTAVDTRLRRLRTFKVVAPNPGDPTDFNGGVDRATLRQVLLNGLGDRVRWGHRCVGCEETAGGGLSARFEDGSTEDGDVLVGADGVSSIVRSQMLPEARVPETGECCLYGRTPLAALPAERVPRTLFDGFTIVAARPCGMALGLMQFRDEPADASALAAAAAPWPPVAPYIMWAVTGRWDEMPASRETLSDMDGAALKLVALRLINGWHDDLHALVGAAAEDAIRCLPVRVAEPVPPWPASRVTLLGDAIHAMSPSQGSGANVALQDAAELSRALAAAARGDLPLVDAVGAYEREMRERGFQAVGASNPIVSGRRRGLLETLRRLWK